MKKMKKAVILTAILTIIVVSFSMLTVYAIARQNRNDPYMTFNLDLLDVDKVDAKISGKNTYIAILDSGLTSYWKEFIPENTIEWGWVRRFHDTALDFEYENGEYPEWGGWDSVVESHDIVASNDEWIDEGQHGTKLISYITGWHYNDKYTGKYYFFEGIAPRTKVIPLKVRNAYQLEDGSWVEGWNDYTMASGIKYITDLAEKNPNKRFIIDISTGVTDELIGEEIVPWYDIIPETITAIDNAIEANVVVVAAAGNFGMNFGGYRGMMYPAAIPKVISVGASFWLDNEWVPYEFNDDGTASYNPLWFLNDVPEEDPKSGIDNGDYSGVSLMSSRALIEVDQELDVFAPGGFVVGPGKAPNGPDPLSMYYYDDTLHYAGGTSGAAPQIAGIIALMLDANSDLSVSEVESILKASADEMAPWYLSAPDLPAPFDGGYFIPPYPGFPDGTMLPNCWGIIPVPWWPSYLQDIGYDLGSGVAQADLAVEMALNII
jgi:subtilisin family serine protease